MSAADPGLRIFIAYRRDDSQGFARSIHDRLALHYGQDSVFRDINDIEPGTPWEESIDEALGSCEVFVLLIGPRWLNATDEEGNRRLDNPQDRHRREIETAVARKIRMFVALMEDAHMPSRKQLPANADRLQKVPSLHALRIADHAFDYGIAELISSIDTAVEHARAEARESERQRDADAESERTSVAWEREDKPSRAEKSTDRKEQEQWPDAIHRSSGGRSLRGVAVAAVFALAAIVAVFLIASSGDENGSSSGSAEVFGDAVEVGQAPVELAGGEDGIWVADRAGRTVTLIMVSPDGQEPGRQLQTDGSPEGIATDGATIWVASRDRGEVSHIDPNEGASLGKFDVGASPGSIAISDDAVWVANNGDATVSRISLDGGEVDSITVESAPYGVAVSDDLVWVTNRESNSVSRLPLDGGEALAPIDVGANPKGIDVTQDAAWVANTGSGTVTRIDVQSEDTEEFPVGNQPRDVVVAFDSVWVTLGEDDQVARLDPESGEVDQLIDVGDGPEGITAGADSVWVANGLDGTVDRIKP